MRTVLRKVGNSTGIVIPKPLLSELGFDGPVDMRIEGDALVITKPARKTREGWAEASQAIAAGRQSGTATYTSEERDYLAPANSFDDSDWT